MKKSVITIGTFDGVHTGHRQIFKEVLERSKKTGYAGVALVFKKPPKHILNPLHELSQLTLWPEKKQLIKNCGIRHIIPLTFTHHLARTPPANFFRRLIRQFGMKEMIVGFNFSFGKDREARRGKLIELGRRYNVKITIVPPTYCAGEIISASRIRELIRRGELAAAYHLLGYHYRISGIVVHGSGWGSKNNIPTANLFILPEKLLPRGVFIVKAVMSMKSYPGIVSIGLRPTLHAVKHYLPEVYIFDKTFNLYGKKIYIELLKKVRDEHRFSSPEELLRHIKQDIAAAKKYFLL